MTVSNNGTDWRMRFPRIVSLTFWIGVGLIALDVAAICLLNPEPGTDRYLAGSVAILVWTLWPAVVGYMWKDPAWCTGARSLLKAMPAVLLAGSVFDAVFARIGRIPTRHNLWEMGFVVGLLYLGFYAGRGLWWLRHRASADG